MTELGQGTYVRDPTLSPHYVLFAPLMQIDGAVTVKVPAGADTPSINLGTDLTADNDGTTGVWRLNDSSDFAGVAATRDTTSDDHATQNHGGMYVPAGVFSFTPKTHSILFAIRLRRGSAIAALALLGHRVNNGESFLLDHDSNANGGGPRLIIRDDLNNSVTQTYDNATIGNVQTPTALQTVVIAYDSVTDVLTHTWNGVRHASTNRSLATLTGNVTQTNTFGFGNFGNGGTQTTSQAWRFRSLHFLKFTGTPTNFEELRRHLELFPDVPISARMAP